MENKNDSATNHLKTGCSQTAACATAFFLFCVSLICPYSVFAEENAYETLASQAGTSVIPVPAPPPANAYTLTGKMNTSRELKIIGMSESALAAASPEKKVEILKDLISRSNPNQQNTDTPDQDQPVLERAIVLVLASATDAASFDRVYYRLNHDSLNRAVSQSSAIQEMVNKHRATVVPGDWEGLRSYVDTVTETSHSGRNFIKFLIDGVDAIPEGTKAFKAATKSIHIEIFQLQGDNIGWGLAKLLAAQAKTGVRVRLLLDEHGSKSDSDPEVIKIIAFLRENGADVRTKKLSITRNHLDHRKVIVIDGRVGFTGGMNIGRSYQVDWHDQQTLVIGPAVTKLQESFLERWQAAGGSLTSSEELLPRLEEFPGGAETQVVGHIGRRDQNMKALYLRAIGTAQKSIRIANPYFTDMDVVKALCKAAKRNVKVQLVLPQDNNIGIVQHASRYNYPRLIKAGVEIYEYKGRMAHEKVAVFDSRWATFGSSNLDARSLINNDELNLIVTDTGVAEDIEKRLFEADIPKSERISKYSPDFMDHLMHPFGGLL